VPRHNFGVLLALFLGACSPKQPPPGDSGPAALHAPPTAAGVQVAVPPPDPREAALAEIVSQLLEQEHLLGKKIDDGISRAAFASYLDRLDGGKMFLLRGDREALARHADLIDDELRSGSLALGHDGAQIFAARVAVVDQLVASLLAKPFDLTNEEFYEVDPEKTEPAATEEELSERWRRRLELDVLERVAQMEARLSPDKDAGKNKDKDKDEAEEKTAIPLAQIPTTPEGREAKARADLAKSYSGRFARLRTPGPLDAAADVVNAVSGVLDPHTTYLPPADKANFDIQMSGSLEGIGAVLRERDHYIEITEIVPGGASWRQGGLAPGDLILSVAAEGKEPVDVVDMRIDDVVKMIRGPKQTIVRLRVQKPSGTEETVAITRDVVVIEEAYARGAVMTRKGQPSYGYIHLPSFYGGNGKGQRSAAGDVRKLLAELKSRRVAGIVLDLRSNGGGLLGDAVELTGELIDRGPVVQIQDGRGKREVLADDKKGFDFDGHVVVLVDRFSASASEIVAGALQDYQRAVIVGTGPTHGKGTVQTLADLDRATGGTIELGVLKITIQQFFRVTGSSTQQKGVVPDVMLPDPAGHIDAGERELDHAIAWSSIPPANYQRWAANWKTDTLVQRSAARVGKHPILGKIAAATPILRERQKDTRVPLSRPAWETRRKEQRAALEAASPDLKKATPAFTVQTIADPAIPEAAPGPGGKKDDRLVKWRDALARDPWVDESVSILADMK
jgi:carboxyl-terminal processing protease